MQSVDVGGHALRVEARGAGSPSFVLLHGLVDTLEIWDAVFDPLAKLLEALADARHRLFALRAFVIQALIAFHDKDPHPHSMGGIVAMTTALAHPERVAALVLLGTASHCSERIADWYERIAQAGESEGNEGLARIIYGKHTRKRVRGDAAGIARVTRTLKSLHADPLTPKLAALSCPALLLVGERDPMGPKASEIIRENLREASLRVLPEQGHWLHVDAPEAVLEALDLWWSERRSE